MWYEEEDTCGRYTRLLTLENFFLYIYIIFSIIIIIINNIYKYIYINIGL